LTSFENQPNAFLNVAEVKFAAVPELKKLELSEGCFSNLKTVKFSEGEIWSSFVIPRYE
jgi:hypothetical protein